VAFEGFQPEALRFLRDLGENNSRDWFHAHREDYEALLLEPAREFVIAMGEELQAIGADVHAEPRVNGSISRINRDTRFSKDKRPYKDHLDLWFWEGEGPSRQCPGYWFRLSPERLILGAGRHHLEPPLLDRFREAVADDARGEALRHAVEQVRASGYEIGGQHYKRVPRGYDAPPEREELLLHAGLYSWTMSDVPPETHTAQFPRFCAERWRGLKPVEDWIVAELS
jgi:uncharacterized protein (TIGR02453 family)